MRVEVVAVRGGALAEHGYHATGIADIATRLGIGHGFYRYFQNKRDIVDHVINDLVERVVAALAEENAPEAAGSLSEYREQTARIGAALTRIVGSDPRIPRFLLLEAAGIDAEMRDRVLDFHETAAQLTAGYLHHGVRVGYLRADLDVDATARAINGMILAAVLAAQKNMSEAIRRVMYDGIAA